MHGQVYTTSGINIIYTIHFVYVPHGAFHTFKIIWPHKHYHYNVYKSHKILYQAIPKIADIINLFQALNGCLKSWFFSYKDLNSKSVFS